MPVLLTLVSCSDRSDAERRPSEAAESLLPTSGGTNGPAHLDAPYVVLISLDGFRHDYPELHAAPTIDGDLDVLGPILTR